MQKLLKNIPAGLNALGFPRRSGYVQNKTFAKYFWKWVLFYM